MKKFLFSILILSFVCTANAQITFQKTFGSNEIGWFAQQTTDGGYIISGTTYNYGTNTPNVYLIKLNSNGDTIWTKSYGGTSNDISWYVQQTTSGYILSGWTSSFGAGYIDVYLINTDANGNILWTKMYGGLGDEFGRCVKQTSDGGYIVAGYRGNGGSNVVFVIKVDNSGNTLWTKTFGGIGNNSGKSVIELVNGGYVIAGSCNSNNTDVFLISTNFAGDTLWTKSIGGTSFDEANSVQQTTDGGLIMTGSTSSFGTGGTDVYLIKTDSLGNLLWSKAFGGIGNDFGNSVQQTSDGGYIIAGKTNSFSVGGSDFYVIKTNSNGETLWTKTYGGTGNEEANSIQETTDGGYIITGFTNSFGGNGYIIYLIKTDANGNSGCNEGNPTTIETNPATQVTSIGTTVTSPTIVVTTTSTIVSGGGIDSTICILVGSNEIATDYSFTIFPNPTSGTFIISFERIILNGYVEVLNILGDNIYLEKIFNESKKEFNIGNISDGIYLVKVYDGERSYCKKIFVQHD